jgi:TPR repeat protein
MFSLSWLQIAHGQKATTGLIRLHTMAEKGDATAQYELAEEYRIGFSIQRDHKKALDLYKRSAEQGYASSQFRLGELYEKGEVIERDLRKAVKLYRKAAEQGHIGGQYALAYLYHVGTSVELLPLPSSGIAKPHDKATNGLNLPWEINTAWGSTYQGTWFSRPSGTEWLPSRAIFSLSTR